MHVLKNSERKNDQKEHQQLPTKTKDYFVSQKLTEEKDGPKFFEMASYNSQKRKESEETKQIIRWLLVKRQIVTEVLS